MPKGVYIRTEETRKIISKALKGHGVSEETKRKLSQASKRGGIKIDVDGYRYIYMPSHPCATQKHYVFEHHLVMEKHIGRTLSPKEIVHHINGDVKDNRIENLMLFSNAGDHTGYHHTKRGYKVSRIYKNII